MKTFAYTLILIVLSLGLGATNPPQQVSPATGSYTWNQVIFDWDTTANALAYEFQLDTSNLFSSPVFIDSVIASTPSGFETFADLQGLYFGREYFWRVRSWTISDTSAWSPVWTCTTRDSVLIAGPADQSLQFAKVILNWNAHPGILYYDYQYDITPNFNSAYLQSGSNFYFSPGDAAYDSEKNIQNLQFGTTYYWRVRARNAIDTSAWNMQQFDTRPAPELNFPAENDTVPVGLTIDWLAFNGAVFYDYEVDVNPSFNSPSLISGSKIFLGFSNNNTDTEHFIDDLMFGSQYFWRVRVRHNADTSAWAESQFYTSDLIQLSSPANNSVLPVEVNLDWEPHPGVDKYEYQLDTTINFNSPLLLSGTKFYINANDGNEDTHQEISGLLYGKTYFWRVRSWNAVDTCSWSELWSFSTQNQCNILSPLNLSSTYTQIDFQWDEFPGSGFYQLQVDSTNSFNSQALQEFQVYSNQKTIPNFRFGTNYFWRIRAANSIDTSEWTPAYQFYTLDQIGLVSPLPGEQSVDSFNLTLDWLSHTGAQQYEFELDSSNTFSTPFLIHEVLNYLTSATDSTDTEYTINTLDSNRIYFWRVRVINEIDTSKWEERWFATGEQTLILPDAPALLYPLLNQTGVTTEPVLDWSDVSGAQHYEYQIGTSPDLYDEAIITVTASEAPVFGLDFLTSYFWRVRTFDGNLISDWSTVFNFTTSLEILGTPQLQLPANNSTGNSTSNLYFDWSDIVNAQFYQIMLSTDANFLFDVINEQVNSSHTTLSNLQPDATYYWHVKAINDTLINGSWSEVWTFQTLQSLETPILTSPLNNATGINVNGLLLTWEPVANALSYEIEIAEDPFFAAGYQQDMTNDAFYYLNNADPLTTYFWHVKAVNDTMLNSDWSESWNFTTNEDTLAIYESENTSKLRVYPNPVQNLIFIETQTENNCTAIIYSISGKMLLRKKFYGSVKMDISQFDNGIYLLSILRENEPIQNIRMVKQ